MAVPKRKTGKSRKLKRRAQKNLSPSTSIKCKNCDTLIPTHRICPKCGFYRNKYFIKKDKNEN